MVSHKNSQRLRKILFLFPFVIHLYKNKVLFWICNLCDNAIVEQIFFSINFAYNTLNAYLSLNSLYPKNSISCMHFTNLWAKSLQNKWIQRTFMFTTVSGWVLLVVEKKICILFEFKFKFKFILLFLCQTKNKKLKKFESHESNSSKNILNKFCDKLFALNISRKIIKVIMREIIANF